MTVFFATFILLMVMFRLAAQFEWKQGFVMDRTVIPQGAIVVLDGVHYVEHMALHHDLGGFIDYAREADVLVLGNSRAQCGFDPDVLRAVAAQGGPVFYNLACSEENIKWGRALIEQHGLQPDTVVVAVDHLVLSDEQTPRSLQAASTPWWTVCRMMLEGEARWALGERLHKFVPRITLGQFHSLRNRWIIAREVATGSWRPLKHPMGNRPAVLQDPATDIGLNEERLNNAKDFVADMKKKGIEVVFTYVPSAAQSPQQALDVAEALAVPLILVSGDELRTLDGSHLVPDSAKRFTIEFLRQFELLRNP